MQKISRSLVTLNTGLLILVNVLIMKNIWHLNFHWACWLAGCVSLDLVLLLITCNRFHDKL